MCVKCLAAAEANELTAKLANAPPAAAAAADIMMRVHTSTAAQKAFHDMNGSTYWTSLQQAPEHLHPDQNRTS